MSIHKEVLARFGDTTRAPKTGAKEGKTPMSLLPIDILRKYVTPAYEEGVIKYVRESWRMGFPVSELIDSALRHIEEFYWKGEDFDPDAWEANKVKKHHLAGAIFSLLSILHTLEVHPEMDDRPNKKEDVQNNEFQSGFQTAEFSHKQ